MQLAILSIKSIIWAWLGLGVLACSPEPTTQKMGINRELLLQLVNKQRQAGCRCGGTYHQPLPPLVWSNAVENVAAKHSESMARHNYFSHTGRDGSNTGDRLERAGYKWMAYAENIYMTSGYVASEQEVINAWIKSPGHCANIMNPHVKEMAVAKAGDYWTQVFAAPMPTRR